MTQEDVDYFAARVLAMALAVGVVMVAVLG